MIDTTMMMNDNMQNFEDVNKVKKLIISFFNSNALIENIKQNIIDSDIFEFTSERSAKFINIDKPVFIIKINKELALKKYPTDSKTFRSSENETNWITDCVHKEIVSKFSTFLYTSVNDKLFKNKLNGIFKEEIPKETIELGIMMSSIFGTRINLTNYTVTLEYIR